ncbi:MAG: hypothetical protein H6739_29955 [Alphaproteobacteria bacterium]|nr:hypothetical protein [Alphaproteobacteria bacterium]
MSQADAAGPLIARARRLLWGLAVFWLLSMVVSLLLDAPVEGGPPMWLARGALAVASGFTAIAATGLRPLNKGGWATAVSAAALSLLNCLSFPVGAWLVWLLFRKPVMAACLGGKFAE